MNRQWDFLLITGKRDSWLMYEEQCIQKGTSGTDILRLREETIIWCKKDQSNLLVSHPIKKNLLVSRVSTLFHLKAKKRSKKWQSPKHRETDPPPAKCTQNINTKKWADRGQRNTGNQRYPRSRIERHDNYTETCRSLENRYMGNREFALILLAIYVIIIWKPYDVISVGS